MQQVASRPDPRIKNGGASSSARSLVILIIALLLFSLAGLASGFSVGALTRSTKNIKQPITKIHTTVPVVGAPTATAIPTQAVTTVAALGCPQIVASSSINQVATQLPDGQTPYTFAAQAVDQTGGKCKASNQAIHMTGITFKLWVTKHIPGDKILQLPADVLKQTGQLEQPTTGTIDNNKFPEMTDALQFDANSGQVQQSNNQGQANWNYKVNPAVPDGTYSLVVLTDSQGHAFNWSWYNFIVKKQA